MQRSRRQSWLIRACVLAGLILLFSFAPAFHVVNLKTSQQQTVDAAFDASVFVEKLWSDQLKKSIAHATDAAILLPAIQHDPNMARTKFGRNAGLGSSYYFYLAGTGRVLSADAHGVALAITADSKTPEVVLETGNIFGNAIRDGTGVLDVNSFANSQDFNAISSELNHRIEERVLPALRSNAHIGSTVEFAGCAEINDEESDLHPLRVIPLSAAVK